MGEWKLSPEASHANLYGTGAALFHLTSDQEGQVNLSQEYPERVSKMKALAEERLVNILNERLSLSE